MKAFSLSLVLFGATLIAIALSSCKDLSADGASSGTDTHNSGESTESEDTQTDTSDTASDFSAPDAEHPYHACSEAASTGEDPVISDFENDEPKVLPNEGRGGVWFSYDDGTNGTLTMEDESGALHILSSDWSGWGAGVGVTIGPSLSDTEHCYYDAGRYDGIRFRAKGAGRFRTMVVTMDNLPVSQGGACERSGEDCYNWPGDFTSLTDDWQTFEYPFCTLKPELGWGGEVAPLDASKFVSIQFRLAAGSNFDVWMDDLEFYTEENAEGTYSCSQACPMDAVPYPDMVMPEFSYITLTDELTLHTFEQETADCGPILRRYISYVPSTLEERSGAPLIIALHGSATNAETFQDFYTHGGLDELAARDGFIVVYGNAAPGASSSDDPNFPNTGSWRQDINDDGTVDDVAYLDLVIEDLKNRKVISGDNDLFLIGLSNGGGMVLKAARERPEMWKGIAPFMAFDGSEPKAVPNLTGTALTRILFGFASDDPGLPDGYEEVLSALPSEWASALGLPEEIIENPTATALPDVVNEGEDYTGENAAALATRSSSVTQYDMTDPSVSGALRILKFERGGHLWPNPTADTDIEIVETLGFRNQDIDASSAVWEFFKSAE